VPICPMILLIQAMNPTLLYRGDLCHQGNMSHLLPNSPWIRFHVKPNKFKGLQTSQDVSLKLIVPFGTFGGNVRGPFPHEVKTGGIAIKNMGHIPKIRGMKM